jgi:hypothetical protein
VTGLALFGACVSVLWFPIAYLLGKRYESLRGPEPTATVEGAR